MFLYCFYNRLKYSITEGNDGNVFSINSNSGLIRTTKKLDRETKSSYRLTILGQNTDNRCHKGRAVVLVNVKDTNDNSPSFPDASYSATVPEENPANTFVTMVTATDADTGVNAQLTYSIHSGNNDKRFTINDKGEVKTTKKLNYEEKSSYTLGITAEDGGNPPKSDTTVLTVTVEDINEPPYFVKGCAQNNTCKFSVKENNNRNTPLGLIQARDPDAGCSSLTYEIVTEQSQNSKVFGIDNNGEVKVLVKLDRELKPHYTAVITVQDCGSPALKVLTRIQVEVLDENDESPRFTLNSYKASVQENIAVGSTVVQISAIGESVLTFFGS